MDTFEELMLSFAMEMMHGQKWDGENWVKAHEGWQSVKNLRMKTD